MNPELDRRLPRSFWALNISQFLGAMNDNVFRWVAAWALVTRASIPGSEVMNESPIAISGALFAIPFILFSSSAGILADRFSKRRIIVLCNFSEFIIMILGLFAFISNQPLLIYGVLFLMVAQSTFFGPGKMGILPELVKRDRLSHANGLMSLFVWMAMIIGTLVASLLFDAFGAKPHGSSTFALWQASIFCILFAFIGFVVSLYVRDTGVRPTGKHLSPMFWKDVSRNLRKAWPNRYLFLAIFAVAFFLFLGGFVQMNVMTYGHDQMGLSKADATLLFIAVAFGMGIGSYLAGRISRRNVEIGLVPVGAILISICLFGLMFSVGHLYFVIGLLFFLGLGGGFYIVPLNTYIQEAAPEEDRGELIATGNFLSFCGLMLAAGLIMLLDLPAINMAPSIRFGLLGLLTVGLTIAVVRVLPDFLVRFIGLLMARIVYRLESIGIENVPYQGGALLVGNHVSYVDAVLLGATHQRRIRFLMARDIYEHSLFKWLFDLMRVIPISQNDNPRQVIKSLKMARQALDDGYLVCIFGEGSLSRTGYIMEFKRGLERIVRDSDYPIIPVCLHGIWGSILSYSQGKLMGRVPRPLRRRVTVIFGKPMPPDSNAFDVRQEVMQLQSRAFEQDRQYHKPLPVEFARMARSKWKNFAMADTLGKKLNFGKALIASLALADRLRPDLGDASCVGILLPSSVGGALANIAVSFSGRVPVNLNYTASQSSIDSAISQCKIDHVITSRSFLEKMPFENLPGILYMEDLAKSIGRGAKIKAFLRARLWPAACLLRTMPDEKRRATVDDTAVIIFSSGSTGEPKGVILSHYNIIANAESCQQIFTLNPDDVICGILPFFHSFGFTVTLWLPMLVGCGVAYHFNPMEAEKVGRLVEKHKCSMIACTPTFLLTYVRKVKPEQFASLRTVITGAEKLKQKVADRFEERFGVTPMEGYGATELSPVASVNQPDVVIGNIEQKAYLPGSIGRPIPGVTMKVVDPENTEKDLGYGQEGLLLVKGPNVMQGYLNQPEKTAEVMRGDWYVTGDVARIEHDGFVHITDRLSRFSKIGGEMVPHQLIEEKIQEGLERTETVCAVTSLPDEKRGEKIVLLLTPDACEPEEAIRILREAELPNLWIPSAKNIIKIDSIPLLGSGKMDLKGIRELARTKLSE
ncbi:MAG: acyl-[ACP]--phospholipid O-acyltransferase [Candidatus Sumerlaeia bacterium]